MAVEALCIRCLNSAEGPSSSNRVNLRFERGMQQQQRSTRSMSVFGLCRMTCLTAGAVGVAMLAAAANGTPLMLCQGRVIYRAVIHVTLFS